MKQPSDPRWEEQLQTVARTFPIHLPLIWPVLCNRVWPNNHPGAGQQSARHACDRLGCPPCLATLVGRLVGRAACAGCVARIAPDRHSVVHLVGSTNGNADTTTRNAEPSPDSNAAGFAL